MKIKHSNKKYNKIILVSNDKFKPKTFYTRKTHSFNYCFHDSCPLSLAFLCLMDNVSNVYFKTQIAGSIMVLFTLSCRWGLSPNIWQLKVTSDCYIFCPCSKKLLNKLFSLFDWIDAIVYNKIERKTLAEESEFSRLVNFTYSLVRLTKLRKSPCLNVLIGL